MFVCQLAGICCKRVTRVSCGVQGHTGADQLYVPGGPTHGKGVLQSLPSVSACSPAAVVALQLLHAARKQATQTTDKPDT